MRRDGTASDGQAGDGQASDGQAGDGQAGDGQVGDGQVDDDEAHLAALLALLALARADASPDGARLQQWRAGRLAALSADSLTARPGRAVPRTAGQRRPF